MLDCLANGRLIAGVAGDAEVLPRLQAHQIQCVPLAQDVAAT